MSSRTIVPSQTQPDPTQRSAWDRLWRLLLAEPKEEAALESRPDDELVDNDDRSTY